MVVDRNYIDRSEGAKRLVEYCEKTADELNVELAKEPYWVLAAKEDALKDDYCKLIIQAVSNSAMVSLSREEIEKYSTNVGCINIENKIKSKLETLK